MISELTLKELIMLLENQNPDEGTGENENYLESSSQIELPAKSLTELEQEYYQTIQN